MSGQRAASKRRSQCRLTPPLSAKEERQDNDLRHISSAFARSWIGVVASCGVLRSAPTFAAGPVNGHVPGARAPMERWLDSAAMGGAREGSAHAKPVRAPLIGRARPADEPSAFINCEGALE